MTMARTPPATKSRENRAAEWASCSLGGWLFISAFSWAHSAPSFTNTWLTGLAIAIVSALAAFVRRFRWLNTTLAVWLFLSTLVIEHATVATLWHNALLAVLVFGISIAPSTPPGKVPRGTVAPLAR
jgi:hypothetical protein